MRRICFFLLLITVCLHGWAQLPTTRSLFIAHTSDSHSCIEPISPNFADTAQANKGGYMRRIALLKQLRRQYPNNLLLFDCGDFSQGSVYYNLFRAENIWESVRFTLNLFELLIKYYIPIFPSMGVPHDFRV